MTAPSSPGTPTELSSESATPAAVEPDARGRDASIETPSPAVLAPGVELEARGGHEARSPIVRVSNGSRDTVVLMLPPTLLEFVRTSRWDDDASYILEQFVTSTFDTNGDGSIDDLERIYAVRALRDAVWDDVSLDEDIEADPVDPVAEDDADGTPATLSAEDRRLHHDVDQARRREREETGGGDAMDDARRSEIVVHFAIVDDGRVTTAELARYLSARRSNLPSADLNGDGAVNDVDLRLYLDVASPILEH